MFAAGNSAGAMLAAGRCSQRGRCLQRGRCSQRGTQRGRCLQRGTQWGRCSGRWKPAAVHNPRDTHCLCYDFNITAKFRPEPRWCEVQGLVDERPFLHYDCVNHKAKAFASLGKKVNVTKTWEKQTETLGDVVDFLKGQLPDIQVENLVPIGKFQIVQDSREQTQ
uniref:Uncharacterized protein n=1 Tax=Macaca mulatta TaxID=9544 RepID=F7G7P6_MACMU